MSDQNPKVSKLAEHSKKVMETMDLSGGKDKAQQAIILRQTTETIYFLNPDDPTHEGKLRKAIKANILSGHKLDGFAAETLQKNDRAAYAMTMLNGCVQTEVEFRIFRGSKKPIEAPEVEAGIEPANKPQ